VCVCVCVCVCVFMFAARVCYKRQAQPMHAAFFAVSLALGISWHFRVGATKMVVQDPRLASGRDCSLGGLSHWLVSVGQQRMLGRYAYLKHPHDANHYCFF
jgi:hypothetical protein